MFGFIGKLAGGVVGGLLDKIGLGKIAPFVKLGLNALTGNWLGVAQDIFGLVSKFKGNPLNNASNRPPLGAFEQPSNTEPANSFRSDDNCNCQNDRLDSNRMNNLFRALRQLFRGFRGLNNGNTSGGLNRIFDAFRTLSEAFGNNRLYNSRVSISQYTNIQV